MSADANMSLVQKADAWRREALGNKHFRMGIVGALAVTLLDQLSKYWIVHLVELPIRRKIELSGIFDLTFVQNYGASFGMLAGGLGSRILLSVISTSVVIGLAIWLGKIDRKIAAAGIALIIGGAAGNLYDRIAYGYVVDFLDFSGLYFPWVFNVADAAINVGIALLLLDAWQTRERKPAK